MVKTPCVPFDTNSNLWACSPPPTASVSSCLAPSSKDTFEPCASKKAFNLSIMSPGSTPSMSRWIGWKERPGSWTLLSSTRAKRAGWSSPAPFALTSSQHRLAVAREWLPSPTAKRIGSWSGPAPYFSLKRSFEPSCRRASATWSMSFRSATWWPVKCPLSSMRSKSYNFRIAPFFSASASGSITVLSGSSISTKICGDSYEASLRMAMRGGSRDSIVFSVGRIRDWEPLAKEYSSKSKATTKPNRESAAGVFLSTSTKPGVCGMNTLFFLYSSMFCKMPAMISSSLFCGKYTSGYVRCNIEGLSPTRSATRFQYAGSEVYWSHAMTDHFLMSVPSGGSTTAGAIKPMSA
mmetsp:Transcript_65576/g.200838  ORF Transcript_65576/g.200838 Transcript_65576/m.200838 type:complete len:350 (+) Transcript_65576:417-1466(+)